MGAERGRREEKKISSRNDFDNSRQSGDVWRRFEDDIDVSGISSFPRYYSVCSPSFVDRIKLESYPFFVDRLFNPADFKRNTNSPRASSPKAFFILNS